MPSLRAPFSRISGHTIFTPALPSRPTVIDLGMHRGGFARGVQSIRPEARIFGVEPQPQLAQSLSAEYGRNFIPAAVGREGGEEAELLLCDAPDMATLRSAAPGSQSHEPVGSVRVPTVSLRDLTQWWGLDHTDLLKVDIEGTEVELFDGGPADFALTRQISVEFHLGRYPADRPRTHHIIGQFRDAGWRVQDFSQVCDDVLFLHPAIAVGTATLHSARLTMGAARRVSRLAVRVAHRHRRSAE